MTMTYTPSWEKKNNKWDTEPEVWDNLLDDETETENAKLADEISLDDLIIEELELDESEFDLEQNFNKLCAIIYVCVRIFLRQNNLFRK